MTGEGGLHGDSRGFGVSHFTHHHHVGVLAKQTSQSGRERHTDALEHVDLVDPAQLIFHRVFHGRNIQLVAVHNLQCGVERGTLSATGRTGHEHHPVRLEDVMGKCFERVFLEPQAFESDGDGSIVE